MTPEELEERQAAREETMRAVGRGVGHAVHIFLVVLVWLVKRLIAWARTVPPFLAALPGRCDRYLAIGAGEGNDILHWFLRIFSATIAVVVFVGIVMFGIRSVKSIFQPQPQAEVAVSHNDGLQPNEDLQPAESVSPPPATTPVAMPAMPIPSNPPDIRPAVPQSIDRPIERPQPATDKPTISEDTFAGESEQAFQEMVNASVRKTNKLWLSCY